MVKNWIQFGSFKLLEINIQIPFNYLNQITNLRYQSLNNLYQFGKKFNL
jgi:hypothetical protein